MSLHSITKNLPTLPDEQFLLLIDLLTEAKDNESGELYLQMDEEGKADVEALVALQLNDQPLFENVACTEDEEGLCTVQMTLSAAAAALL